MLILPLRDRLAMDGPHAVERWRRTLSQARQLLREGGHVFHGTSLARAQAIMAHGFRWHDGHDGELDRLHVYWGPFGMAGSFASKSSYTSQPALLAARLDDVVASGEALPMSNFDRQVWPEDSEPELADWRASVAESGALRVRGGCRVAGIRLLGET